MNTITVLGDRKGKTFNKNGNTEQSSVQMIYFISQSRVGVSCYNVNCGHEHMMGAWDAYLHVPRANLTLCIDT